MNEYGSRYAQAFAVFVCVLLAGIAPLYDSLTTELFLMSVGGGAACSAWIFVTSAAGHEE